MIDKEAERKGGRVCLFFVNLKADFLIILREKLSKVMKRRGIKEDSIERVRNIKKI